MPAVNDIVVVATLDCGCCGTPNASNISEKDGVLACNDECIEGLGEVNTFGQDMDAKLWKESGRVIATVVKPVAFTLHRRKPGERVFTDQKRAKAEQRRAEEEERKYQRARGKTAQERRKADAEERKAETERAKAEAERAKTVQFNVQSILQQFEINMPVLDYKELKQVSKDYDLNEFQRCIVGTAVDYLRQFEQ